MASVASDGGSAAASSSMAIDSASDVALARRASCNWAPSTCAMISVSSCSEASTRTTFNRASSRMASNVTTS